MRVYSLRYPGCNAHALSSAACPVLPNISTLSLKRLDFLFSLQLLSETFLVLIRNQRDIVIDECRSLCKVPVIRVRF